MYDWIEFVSGLMQEQSGFGESPDGTISSNSGVRGSIEPLSDDIISDSVVEETLRQFQITPFLIQLLMMALKQIQMN